MQLTPLGCCSESCVERGCGSKNDPARERVSKEVKNEIAMGTVAYRVVSFREAEGITAIAEIRAENPRGYRGHESDAYKVVKMAVI